MQNTQDQNNMSLITTPPMKAPPMKTPPIKTPPMHCAESAGVKGLFTK